MQPRTAGTRTALAIAVAFCWLLVAGAGTVALPHLEQVIKTHGKSFIPAGTPSSVMADKIAEKFQRGGTNNVNYLILQRQGPLSDVDRAYYGRIIAALRADDAHVGDIADLWSDPLTAGMNLSADRSAVFALLALNGNVGTSTATESVDAARALVASSDPPPGLNVFVAGPGSAVTDELAAIDRDMIIVTVVTVLVIALLLLVVYRSPVTVLVPLATIGLALATARATTAVLGEHDLIELSTFSAALMSAMVLGAGTDYSIFLLGRYHEGRRTGLPAHHALGTAVRQVAPVIVASALTIAVATSALTFARIGILRSAGIPCAIGVLTAMVAALTLTPALIWVGARWGFMEPRSRRVSEVFWRRLGALVARRPAPIIAVTVGLLVACMCSLPSMRLGFSEFDAQPADTPTNRAYDVVAEKFGQNRLAPNLVLIEADHDLRTSGDLIAIEKVTRALFAIPETSTVQSITRPAGEPLRESTLTYQASVIGQRLADGAGQISDQRAVFDQLASTVHSANAATAALTATAAKLEQNLREAGTGLSSFDDATRTATTQLDTVKAGLEPLRNFVDTRPDCPSDAVCAMAAQALRPVDSLTDIVGAVSAGLDRLRVGTASVDGNAGASRQALDQLRRSLAQIPALVGTVNGSLKDLTSQSTQLADYFGQMSESFGNDPAAGFYMPPEVFSDARFQRAVDLLISPDGHSTRLIVYGRGDAFGDEGMQLVDKMRAAVSSAVKGGTLAGSTVSVGGAGAAVQDLRDLMWGDLSLMVLTTLGMVFLIVAFTLRSPAAGAVVVATVVLSYGAALGLSVLIWQHIFGVEIHWTMLSITFLSLVGVGADYNLMYAARLRQEISSAGFGTGTIRTFGSTGGVVTTAGIVFGVTMFAMLGSSVSSIGQVGSTIGIGLLIDTLVVRALLLPALAASLRRRFWWPLSFSIPGGRRPGSAVGALYRAVRQSMNRTVAP
ncbi:hypothetical protein BA059_04970 [Mycolicibacterium sp. (ex Dasyatis americana)]|uniref:MMPL/RND family transporter n=1 Tax=Mycobacterium sp. DBP42 TaxID=2545267 RepID=UPI0008725705|nr:RND family transporter [Mycobacterium sp. DBP42]OFB42564.1 hypothetical protein BA059_04970 [Mycolicibacterium sp. (ex Dasyatis americana)]